MKKILLSSLAVFALASASLASELKLYTDEKGQVFTKPAKGRVELKTATPWYSHADKLKFSVQTFLGYKYSDFDTLADGVTQKESVSKFEIRRAYFQVKAYMMEDPKSYYRITFDVSKDVVGDEKVRAKYAYIYLNEVLPATGIEVGLAHRPWHDYEEHNAWFYRSVSKVLIETKRAGDLSNSADFGVMAKTRTKYFDSDIGIFNGEGYHSNQVGTGMSLEWRATGHLLGISGKDKPEEKTYADVSFFGQINQKHPMKYSDGNKYDTEDLDFYGLHTVYNMPSFLIAAQYVDSMVKNVHSQVSSKAGKGWSVNAEARFGAKKEYKLLGRYDVWTPKARKNQPEYDKKSYIVGAAWKQSKNVEWVANATIKDYDSGILPTNTTAGADSYNGTDYMITVEVKF